MSAVDYIKDTAIFGTPVTATKTPAGGLEFCEVILINLQT